MDCAKDVACHQIDIWIKDEPEEETFLVSLECHICFTIKTTKKFMCSNHHSVCDHCFERFPESMCPWCREPYPNPPVRNIDLEAVIRQAIRANIITKCHHSRCDIYLGEGELEEHMANCLPAAPPFPIPARVPPPPPQTYPPRTRAEILHAAWMYEWYGFRERLEMASRNKHIRFVATCAFIFYISLPLLYVTRVL